MKKMLMVVMIALIGALLTGCSSISGVKVDQAAKVKAAYNIGKIATVVYLAEQGMINQDTNEAITKVWEGFRDNVDKYKDTDPNKFPEFLKAAIAQKVTNQKVLDIANKLVDTYWTKLVKGIDSVAGMTPADFIAVLISFRDGIKDGLAMVNMKQITKP